MNCDENEKLLTKVQRNHLRFWSGSDESNV